jgi:hypothetical protein
LPFQNFVLVVGLPFVLPWVLVLDFWLVWLVLLPEALVELVLDFWLVWLVLDVEVLGVLDLLDFEVDFFGGALVFLSLLGGGAASSTSYSSVFSCKKKRNKFIPITVSAPVPATG